MSGLGATTPSKEMSPNPLPIVPLGVSRKLVERGSQKGKGIAVFTSGGDSQGMNAAVRSVEVYYDISYVSTLAISGPL